MTLRTVVSTRGLSPGDTVARLLPDGTVDHRSIMIHRLDVISIPYHGKDHWVYLIGGVVAPFGREDVEMVTTESTAWCVTRAQ